MVFWVPVIHLKLVFCVCVYILIIALVDIFDQIKYFGIGNDKRIELETILALVCCLSKFMFYG